MPVPLVSLLPVLFSMVPPEPAVEPSPVTVRPLLAPVLSRMMPSPELPLPVPSEMLLNVTPLEPMSVLVMSSAVPDAESIVLPVPVTLTVPPWVSEMPVPESVLTAMLDIVVVPVLLLPSSVPSPAPPPARRLDFFVPRRSAGRGNRDKGSFILV